MIRNLSNGRTIAQNELIARTFFQRLTGMLTRRFSNSLDAIVFENCNAIHTFGMRFPLDVIFVDNSSHVAAVCANVAPWKIVSVREKRCTTIELPAGTLSDSLCSIGDIIEIS